MTAEFDYAEWERDRTARRLEAFLARRPAAHADPGDLDARVEAWMREFIGSRVGSLVISGPTGTGKTWTLWRIGELLMTAGWPGRVEIASMYDLMRMVAPPVDETGLDRLADADLLGLDDLGATRLSDWTMEHLHGIVDRRWSNRRATMIATNVADLRGLLGDRISSRLAANATAVVLDGADRRRA